MIAMLVVIWFTLVIMGMVLWNRLDGIEKAIHEESPEPDDEDEEEEGPDPHEEWLAEQKRKK